MLKYRRSEVYVDARDSNERFKKKKYEESTAKVSVCSASNMIN